MNFETWRCAPDASALWLSHPTGRVLAYSNPATSPFAGLGAPPVGALFSDFFPPEIASAIRSALRGEAFLEVPRRAEPNGARGAEAASATFSVESVLGSGSPGGDKRVGRVTVEIVGKEALVILEADGGAHAPWFDAVVTSGQGEAPLRVNGVVRASVIDLVRAAGERSPCPPIAEGDVTQRIAPFRGKLGDSSPAVPLPRILPGATPEPLRTALAAEGIRTYVRVPFTAAGKDYVIHAVAPTVERVGPSLRKALVAQAVAAVAADRAARAVKSAVHESAVHESAVAVAAPVLEGPPRRHTLRTNPGAERRGATPVRCPPTPDRGHRRPDHWRMSKPWSGARGGRLGRGACARRRGSRRDRPPASL